MKRGGRRGEGEGGERRGRGEREEGGGERGGGEVEGREGTSLRSLVPRPRGSLGTRLELAGRREEERRGEGRRGNEKKAYILKLYSPFMSPLHKLTVMVKDIGRG